MPTRMFSRDLVHTFVDICFGGDEGGGSSLSKGEGHG
jgi:hypothetical protein